MKTQAMLRALANGINPETGELLGTASMTGSPEAIRLLFALAEEFQVEPERQKKVKLSPEERQQKNIAEGRPAKSHFLGQRRKNSGCRRAMQRAERLRH
ncbi:Uncharacterised protein [Serratia plymuthica]|uniref:Uncharacterized protein n=1 Tax=Serratia plymuthica TaxID=82996 RepID=A0A2X4V7P1_SERPL|nr:Uncharacterised protein [Serratia plymuthica]